MTRLEDLIKKDAINSVLIDLQNAILIANDNRILSNVSDLLRKAFVCIQICVQNNCDLDTIKKLDTEIKFADLGTVLYNIICERQAQYAQNFYNKVMLMKNE